MIDKINPYIIFAALAIIFGILNLFLWYMVWRNSSKSSDTSQDSKTGLDLIKEIKGEITKRNEKVVKLEDQLWGVLDKLKELEKGLNRFTEILSSLNRVQGNGEILETINTWNKKGLAIIKEYFEEIEKLKDSGENIKINLKTIENLNEILTAIDDNIGKLNNPVKKP